MRPIPPTDAELRLKYQPGKTFAVLCLLGAFLNGVRNALFGIPVTPIRHGLTTFFELSLLGVCYFAAIEAWLLLRRLLVR